MDSTTVFDPEYVTRIVTGTVQSIVCIIILRLTDLAIGLGYAFALPLISFTLTAFPACKIVQRASAGRDIQVQNYYIPTK